MYNTYMAHLTIYLSDELQARVRAHGFNVSEVCQNALRQEVRRREHKRPPVGWSPKHKPKQRQE